VYPNVEAKMVTGEPWEKILENAREIGADLIVMGTHGRRGISRALIGSVAEKVVRLASVPVLVARAEEHAPA
jgi:nucleotide-binding universal stress UspA family protein